jgi:hypothetical protein
MSYYPQSIPTLTYWECMWNVMHKVGWKLSHSAFSDERTGGVRHLIRAKKSKDEIICSAPTIGQAVQMVFAQTRGQPSDGDA